jgi:hypothetical protein
MWALHKYWFLTRYEWEITISAVFSGRMGFLQFLFISLLIYWMADPLAISFIRWLHWVVVFFVEPLKNVAKPLKKPDNFHKTSPISQQISIHDFIFIQQSVFNYHFSMFVIQKKIPSKQWQKKNYNEWKCSNFLHSLEDY